MTRPIALLFRTSLLLVILAAVGLCWQLSHEPFLAEQRLSDGRSLRLLGVEYGRHHRYVGGPLWKRLSLAKTLLHVQPQTYEWETPSEELTAWIRSNPDLPHLSAQTVGSSLNIEDSHGCRFYGDYSTSAPNMRLAENALVSWGAFPRREPQLQLIYESLRSWQRGGVISRQNGRFTISNPAHGTFPVWTAEPYPITRQMGPLTVTLLAMVPGAPQLGPNYRFARFSFHEGGQVSRDWYPKRVVLYDACGNRRDVSGSQPDANGVSDVAITNMCSQEAAWRLRPLFARVPRTTAVPDYVWKVRTMVPGIGIEQANVGWHFDQGDVHLQFTGLISDVGAAGLHPKDHSFIARMNADGGKNGIRITLRSVVDDRGRELGLPVSDFYRQATSQSLYFQEDTTSQVVWENEGAQETMHVRVRPDSKSVTLTFAIYGCRTAEFLAKP